MLQGFTFKCIGHGTYYVTYESAYDFKVGRYWANRIEDMTIIDATKNCDSPKVKDVKELKRLVKSGKCVHYSK